MISQYFPRHLHWILLFTLILLLTLAIPTLMQAKLPTPQLLTDPFLQFPTPNSVRVVWFTEFPGTLHQVRYGKNLDHTVTAITRQLTRTREDQDSRVGEQTTPGTLYSHPTWRPIWRHEAEVTGLVPGQRVPYQVISQDSNHQPVSSRVFSLAGTPTPGTPLKILLTSDHQLKPMTAANLQKVSETVGQVDAVFFAGDLVNIPDRASEWFDDHRGNAFFPVLQGHGSASLTHDGVTTVYTGGEIIQHAPLFPTIGNHEIMGEFSMEIPLNQQFSRTRPQWAATQLYDQLPMPTATETNRETWIKNHAFNTDTYQEIFSLPEPQTYYATTFGDIRLISLYLTNVWRSPRTEGQRRGRYQEAPEDFSHPENWGYGQHLLAAITPGTPQYQWLVAELQSPEFQRARYKIVMFHHPAHTLGLNVIPPYTDPVQTIERDATGQIQQIRYSYPKEKDYIIQEVVPLLEAAGVQLVIYGHSHLWNRFVSPQGVHFLETSNVGNTHGAYLGDKPRRFPDFDQNSVAVGDPNGLTPAIPTLARVPGDSDGTQPYIASNEVTVFSIFETATGTLSSYYFDTRHPNSAVVKFDQIRVRQEAIDN